MTRKILLATDKANIQNKKWINKVNIKILFRTHFYSVVKAQLSRLLSIALPKNFQIKYNVWQADASQNIQDPTVAKLWFPSGKKKNRTGENLREYPVRFIFFMWLVDKNILWKTFLIFSQTLENSAKEMIHF